MPTSTQAGSSSKSRLEHQWTPEQTYNLLDHILSCPKYTQNFFPTPGHTPAPGISERYAKTLCLSILDGTIWMDRMKQSGWVVVKEGRLKVGRKWDGVDPVTIRLDELPELAVHYKDRLGGYTRIENIPPGSEFAKRWRKYERCPERRWALKYFALKRSQENNSMMVVDPDSLLEVGPSASTAQAKERHFEGAAGGSSSGSRKRASILPDLPSPSKRKKSTPNGSSNTQTSNDESGNPEKQKEVIYVLDSDSDEEPIHIQSKTRQTNMNPSPTFVGSDSNSDSDDDIRSVSPPIITLPYRSFALPPPDSPFRSTIPSPVRLAFPKPIDDSPTDSEDEEINPPTQRGTGMGMGLGVFSTISLTANEDLIGMFTDPNLRPQQAWRNGLPTPPNSRGSGSSSPIKAAGRGWDSALTPEPEARVWAESREDMNFESGLDNDLSEGPDPSRPITPLDTHLVKQPIQQSALDIIENEDVYHNPSEAEREIAARLLRTLTGDDTPHQDIPTTSVEQNPQITVHEETSTGALADWITSHTGSSPAITQVGPAVENGREKRPLLDRMAPGMKGKGKQVEASTNEDFHVHDTNIEGTSYTVGTDSELGPTSSTSGPSTSHLSINPTTIDKATFQVSSSLLDILIAQTQITSPQYLSGTVIAFAPGHIPFKPKLAVFIIALGGIILEECQVRSLRGRRYIIHPIGKGGGGMVDGLEEVDGLGFLEIVGNCIRGSA